MSDMFWGVWWWTPDPSLYNRPDNPPGDAGRFPDGRIALAWLAERAPGADRQKPTVEDR